MESPYQKDFSEMAEHKAMQADWERKGMPKAKEAFEVSVEEQRDVAVAREELRINNEAQFHEALAEAINARNPAKVDAIQWIVMDWMEVEEQKDARRELIEAVSALLTDLDCA